MFHQNSLVKCSKVDSIKKPSESYRQDMQYNSYCSKDLKKIICIDLQHFYFDTKESFNQK